MTSTQRSVHWLGPSVHPHAVISSNAPVRAFYSGTLQQNCTHELIYERRHYLSPCCTCVNTAWYISSHETMRDEGQMCETDLGEDGEKRREKNRIDRTTEKWFSIRLKAIMPDVFVTNTPVMLRILCVFSSQPNTLPVRITPSDQRLLKRKQTVPYAIRCSSNAGVFSMNQWVLFTQP